MSFATFDALLAALSAGQVDPPFPIYKFMATGVAGGNYTSWPVSGNPPAGGYAGTALNAQQCSRTTAGGWGFANPGGIMTRHVNKIEGYSPTASGTGFLILLDRLLYYPGINIATANNNLVNGVALPRYTTGAGVMAFLEVTTALGATAHNMTLTYTNQAGTGSRTTGAQAAIVSSVANRLPHAFQYFPLQAGDTGIRSVQNITNTATSTGINALVLAREIVRLPMPAVGQWNVLDLVHQVPSLPKIEDDACLMILAVWNAAPTTPVISGIVNTVWG